MSSCSCSHFSFVCPTEIVAFHDRIAEFKALDCEVVGMSVDSADSHLSWTKAPRTAGGLGGALAYPLVSDLSHQISESYGCLWHRGHTLRGNLLWRRARPVFIFSRSTRNFYH